MFRFFLILILLSPLPALAQDYQLYPPPSEIFDHELNSISIITKAEMEIGTLPKHPKIIWLGYSNQRIAPNFRGELQTNNQLDFIVTSPGLIDFPPIPIVLENKEFFIRIGDIRVTKNPTPKDNATFEVFWNGSPDPPTEVHLGEAVEVLMIMQVEETGRNRPSFDLPSNRISGTAFHQYTRQAGRKAIPTDFYFSYGSSFFSSFGSPALIYKQEIREIEGRFFRERRYKTRLYFTRVGTAEGHLSATLGTDRDSLRTHLVPIKTKVLPIPPLPNQQALDTGLVGDWSFESRFSPRQPVPGSRFSFLVEISGQGNPNLRKEWNFSSNGFPSVESSLQPLVDTNYEFWEARFTQSLLPTGKVGTLPPVTLAWFNTASDQWDYHQVTPALTLPGFTNTATNLTPLPPSTASITRPILLNLPVPTFFAFALAPFLPFLFGIAHKINQSRNPEAARRKKQLKKLIHQFSSGQGSPDLIDDDLLPILRSHLQLPTGSTTTEIAHALSDPDLAACLLSHAQSSFSKNAPPVDYQTLAKRLSKITLASLLFFFSLAPLRADSLTEANTAFSEANYPKAISLYQSLLESSPNDPNLHLNLAQAHLAANNPALALASCHTALLLDPLNTHARSLAKKIREQLGDTTVSRFRFFDLRPDHWIILAAFFWLAFFLTLGLRKFKTLPLWLPATFLVLTLTFLATAAWRHSQDYASDQFMVIADELPREPKAGTPDWNYPPLRSGQIIRVSEINQTHARILSSEADFWLPVDQLQQVW